MQKKGSGKVSLCKKPNEPKNSPSKEPKRGMKKKAGSDADLASSVAEALADAAAELKAHSGNVEAAPKEGSAMTEVWKHSLEWCSRRQSLP